MELERLLDADCLEMVQKREEGRLDSGLEGGTDGDMETWSWGTGSGKADLGVADQRCHLCPDIGQYSPLRSQEQDSTYRLHCVQKQIPGVGVSRRVRSYLCAMAGTWES